MSGYNESSSAPGLGPLGEMAGARKGPMREAEYVMQQNALRVPVDNVKLEIHRIMQEIIGPLDQVGDDDNIMECGFDSLSTVQFGVELKRSYPSIPFLGSLLFDYPTVSSLAQKIAQEYLPAGMQDLASDECCPQSSVKQTKNKQTLEQQLSNVNVAKFLQSPCSSSLCGGAAMYVQTDRSGPYPLYRRARDGMQSVLIPGAVVRIGDGFGEREALPNEKPCHMVEISSFLIDIEPVSVAAFANFLNAVQAPQSALSDWYLLPDTDTRVRHLPLHCSSDGLWQPSTGVDEQWPMIMVSWYGANAYSLWANGGSWQDYRDAAQGFLPTEAQWEYAARGAAPQNFPWGDTPAYPERLNICLDSEALDPDLPLCDFPLAKVTAELGLSRFGLRGMAGNVWQWCRDAYDPNFYTSPEACKLDAWNSKSGKFNVRTERGGSWVGPAYLARSSYRRGRAAGAKGRCLGFRCIGTAVEVLAQDAT
eukprot:TRINITY_DN50163_c0_g1_i1.p1 TRINITY_DN50163_c0_g1~~TRINITY_DN50163_c0_g1_i1.p1  ORF type:complete len:478 (+),score=59.81 TRINITY_DN50163_c0_g1_i1:96-1529(+)